MIRIATDSKPWVRLALPASTRPQQPTPKLGGGSDLLDMGVQGEPAHLRHLADRLGPQIRGIVAIGGIRLRRGLCRLATLHSRGGKALHGQSPVD